MSDSMKLAELSVGVEASLASLTRSARRDGYKLSGDLRFEDAKSGEVKRVVPIKGKWWEVNTDV